MKKIKSFRYNVLRKAPKLEVHLGYNNFINVGIKTSIKFNSNNIASLKVKIANEDKYNVTKVAKLLYSTNKKINHRVKIRYKSSKIWKLICKTSYKNKKITTIQNEIIFNSKETISKKNLIFWKDLQKTSVKFNAIWHTIFLRSYLCISFNSKSLVHKKTHFKWRERQLAEVKNILVYKSEKPHIIINFNYNINYNCNKTVLVKYNILNPIIKRMFFLYNITNPMIKKVIIRFNYNYKNTRLENRKKEGIIFLNKDKNQFRDRNGNTRRVASRFIK